MIAGIDVETTVWSSEAKNQPCSMEDMRYTLISG